MMFEFNAALASIPLAAASGSFEPGEVYAIQLPATLVTVSPGTVSIRYIGYANIDPATDADFYSDIDPNAELGLV